MTSLGSVIDGSMLAFLGEVTASRCDPSWASLVLEIYTNASFAWPSGQWHVDDRRPQELLDLLKGRAAHCRSPQSSPLASPPTSSDTSALTRPRPPDVT
jgi:hypothetical protein